MSRVVLPKPAGAEFAGCWSPSPKGTNNAETDLAAVGKTASSNQTSPLFARGRPPRTGVYRSRCITIAVRSWYQLALEMRLPALARGCEAAVVTTARQRAGFAAHR